MRVMQLPNLDEFLNFKTIGPTGIGHSDINGRAAAIECYLDFEKEGLPDPIIRWRTFNRELEVYHGELQHKTQYMKHSENYDVHGIASCAGHNLTHDKTGDRRSAISNLRRFCRDSKLRSFDRPVNGINHLIG